MEADGVCGGEYVAGAGGVDLAGRERGDVVPGAVYVESGAAVAEGDDEDGGEVRPAVDCCGVGGVLGGDYGSVDVGEEVAAVPGLGGHDAGGVPLPEPALEGRDYDGAGEEASYGGVDLAGEGADEDVGGVAPFGGHVRGGDGARDGLDGLDAAAVAVGVAEGGGGRRGDYVGGDAGHGLEVARAGAGDYGCGEPEGAGRVGGVGDCAAGDCAVADEVAGYVAYG